MKWDSTGVLVEVFTYKDGLLSKIAHDLRISVPSVDVQAQDDSITARIDLRALQIASAQKDGRDDPSLSDGDKKKILKSLNGEALNTKRHPEAVFEGKVAFPSEDTATLDGRLSLHGETRDLSIPFTVKDGRWVGEAVIHQPDFRIKPFTAMLGTLKIKADVRVAVSAPVAG